MKFRRNLEGLYGMNRFLLVILSAIIFISIYFIASSHYFLMQKAKEDTLEKLRVLANSAALFLDGDAHQFLARKYTSKDDIVTSSQDSVYFKLHKVLRGLYDVNSLSTSIYTIVKDSASGDFEFIISSSDIPYYRHQYINYPQQLRDQFNDGGTVDVYEDENGMWLSAFAPLKNTNGEVVAVVQSDENFDQFIASARGLLLRNIGIALLLFVPFLYFLYRYIQNSIKRDKENRLKLEEQNEEIQSQNDLIKLNYLELEKANKTIEEKNEALDKQVNERTRELMKANQDLETFLYRSSHDIQGPIASLRGVFTLANVDKENSDQYLGMMVNSVDQLDIRVRGINSVFEIKNKVLERTKIDVCDLIHQVIKKEEAQLHPNLSYEVDLPGKLYINGDAEVISIIFHQLINNSIIYNRGNAITIKIVAVKAGFKFVRFVYSDDGVGIEKSVRSTIFDMFQRGNEKSQGAGLGLYAVKLATEKLHGKIELLHSNKGVAFEIIIPT